MLLQTPFTDSSPIQFCLVFTYLLSQTYQGVALLMLIRRLTPTYYLVSKILTTHMNLVNIPSNCRILQSCLAGSQAATSAP